MVGGWAELEHARTIVDESAPMLAAKITKDSARRSRSWMVLPFTVSESEPMSDSSSELER